MTKEQQKELAKKLGLKEQQVYKWWWDQQKKRQKFGDDDELCMNTVKADEFGGYSKAWLADGEATKDASLESIAALLGLDIEKKALALIQMDDPTLCKTKSVPVIQKTEIIITVLPP